jgi:hypothetical protein
VVRVNPVRESTCVDELVDDVKNIYTHIRERDLATRSFRERTVEGATKVVGVEDEKIFVDEESLFLSTDFDCDDGLETTSVGWSVICAIEWTVKDQLAVVESSTGRTWTL